MDDCEIPVIPLWRHATRNALYGSLGMARITIRLNKNKNKPGEPAAYLYVKIAKKLSDADEKRMLQQAEKLMEADNENADVE